VDLDRYGGGEGRVYTYTVFRANSRLGSRIARQVLTISDLKDIKVSSFEDARDEKTPTTRDWASPAPGRLAGKGRVDTSEFMVIKVQECFGLLEETHGFMYLSMSGA
jgi:hypothetical protein